MGSPGGSANKPSGDPTGLTHHTDQADRVRGRPRNRGPSRSSGRSGLTERAHACRRGICAGDPAEAGLVLKAPAPCPAACARRDDAGAPGAAKSRWQASRPGTARPAVQPRPIAGRQKSQATSGPWRSCPTPAPKPRSGPDRPPRRGPRRSAYGPCPTDAPSAPFLSR